MILDSISFVTRFGGMHDPLPTMVLRGISPPEKAPTAA
jgi:hypothetical protein